MEKTLVENSTHTKRIKKSLQESGGYSTKDFEYVTLYICAT